jgi:hypothetical protein
MTLPLHSPCLLVDTLLPCLAERWSAKKDLIKLWPLREALQQLWQEGLTEVHLLWTFFSHGIQVF